MTADPRRIQRIQERLRLEAETTDRGPVSDEKTFEDRWGDVILKIKASMIR
jgi:hypothetical protein